MPTERNRTVKRKKWGGEGTTKSDSPSNATPLGRPMDGCPGLEPLRPITRGATPACREMTCSRSLFVSATQTAPPGSAYTAGHYKFPGSPTIIAQHTKATAQKLPLPCAASRLRCSAAAEGGLPLTVRGVDGLSAMTRRESATLRGCPPCFFFSGTRRKQSWVVGPRMCHRHWGH